MLTLITRTVKKFASVRDVSRAALRRHRDDCDGSNPALWRISSGQQMLKAREGIQYSRGEAQTIETLRTKFNSYCPVQNIPYEQNPFYTCVERAGLSPPPSSRVGCEQNYVNKKSKERMLAKVEEGESDTLIPSLA